MVNPKPVVNVLLYILHSASVISYNKKKEKEEGMKQPVRPGGGCLSLYIVNHGKYVISGEFSCEVYIFYLCR